MTGFGRARLVAALQALHLGVVCGHLEHELALEGPAADLELDDVTRAAAAHRLLERLRQWVADNLADADLQQHAALSARWCALGASTAV
jgi:hypothetical protein